MSRLSKDSTLQREQCDQGKMAGKYKSNCLKRKGTPLGQTTVHPPLQRDTKIDGFLVNAVAAAALSDPAAVCQKRSLFLHLFQNLLPLHLNLRQRLAFSFLLLAWTNHSLGPLAQGISRTDGCILRVWHTDSPFICLWVAANTGVDMDFALCEE